MLVASIVRRDPMCKHLLDIHMPTIKDSAYLASMVMLMFHPSHSTPAKTKSRKTVRPGSIRGLAPHALEKHGTCYLLV